MQLKHVAQQLYCSRRLLGYLPKTVTFGSEGVTLEDALCGDRIPFDWQVEAADYFDGRQTITLRFHVRTQITSQSHHPILVTEGELITNTHF